MINWISVVESLPKNSGNLLIVVLVYKDGKKQDMYNYFYKGWRSKWKGERTHGLFPEI